METNFVFAKNLPEHCRQHPRGRQVRRSNRSALQQQQHTDCHSLASVRLCVRCATKTATNVNGHNKRGNNHNNCAQVRLRNSNKTYLRAALCVRSSRNSNLSRRRRRRRRRRLALAARSSQLTARVSKSNSSFEQNCAHFAATSLVDSSHTCYATSAQRTSSLTAQAVGAVSPLVSKLQLRTREQQFRLRCAPQLSSLDSLVCLMSTFDFARLDCKQTRCPTKVWSATCALSPSPSSGGSCCCCCCATQANNSKEARDANGARRKLLRNLRLQVRGTPRATFSSNERRRVARCWRTIT